MGNKILIISNINELLRVKPERVVYIESDGNYSTMVLHDKTEHLLTMNLSHCQQLIEQQLGKEAETFIRIGKQLIINRALCDLRENDVTISEYHLSFCGYFPANAPKYSIIVSLNKQGLPASGGGMAGPVFHDIVEWMVSHNMLDTTGVEKKKERK